MDTYVNTYWCHMAILVSQHTHVPNGLLYMRVNFISIIKLCKSYRIVNGLIRAGPDFLDTQLEPNHMEVWCGSIKLHRSILKLNFKLVDWS